VIGFHDFGDHFFHTGVGYVEVIWGLLLMALWVAFWAVVIVVVVRLIRRGAQHPRSTSALQVLEERYARGEITRDEFVERQAVLLGREPPA
jgi:putative membrane protein